ncbi:lysoplasmalogenase-like protein TMEM86A isoform X2 [Toxorhynchites rutilus septentrionalis]|uniref:lysoplasmalogenase-like protein TMEM86A isoform X2 n=1 Tax=Toxorhynchites rutilus septentrionalis TaxID=329112 RepID=UPI00247A12A5|nr:lysoplasmalogenase-like protein TMEM86A isoform X2 [Toxorhynchites rutilus septentrionalis]
MPRLTIGSIINDVGPRMHLFLMAIALYFSLIGLTSRRTAASTALKCLPIICLWLFILQSDFKRTKIRRYKSLILIGLIFSCVGDLLLNYDLFEAGMGVFGIAQIFYISAFGFRPLRPLVGIPLYCAGVASLAIMFENFPPTIQKFLPIYGALLLTMCWRSLARINTFKNTTRVACGIGSVLFVISDSIIAIDMFYVPVDYAQTLIMITYYLAQFGIALSVVEETDSAATTKQRETTKSPYQSQNSAKRK